MYSYGTQQFFLVLVHIIVHVGNYTEGNKAKRQDAGLGRRDEKGEKDKEEGGKRKK